SVYLFDISPRILLFFYYSNMDTISLQKKTAIIQLLSLLVT
ncbi:hypothetical protein HMPREF1882_01011, partial [Streptococcus agalactiae]